MGWGAGGRGESGQTREGRLTAQAPGCPPASGPGPSWAVFRTCPCLCPHLWNGGSCHEANREKHMETSGNRPGPTVKRVGYERDLTFSSSGMTRMPPTLRRLFMYSSCSFCTPAPQYTRSYWEQSGEISRQLPVTKEGSQKSNLKAKNVFRNWIYHIVASLYSKSILPTGYVFLAHNKYHWQS